MIPPSVSNFEEDKVTFAKEVNKRIEPRGSTSIFQIPACNELHHEDEDNLVTSALFAFNENLFPFF